MDDGRCGYIKRFGFKCERGGAHCSRTIMLAELTALFSYVGDEKACKNDYFDAIIDDNCLAKRSGRTRLLTARHLTDLYSLEEQRRFANRLSLHRGLWLMLYC